MDESDDEEEEEHEMDEEATMNEEERIRKIKRESDEAVERAFEAVATTEGWDIDVCMVDGIAKKIYVEGTTPVKDIKGSCKLLRMFPHLLPLSSSSFHLLCY